MGKIKVEVGVGCNRMMARLDEVDQKVAFKPCNLRILSLTTSACKIGQLRLDSVICSCGFEPNYKSNRKLIISIQIHASCC